MTRFAGELAVHSKTKPLLTDFVVDGHGFTQVKSELNHDSERLI
jgi:hypothetical protein